MAAASSCTLARRKNLKRRLRRPSPSPSASPSWQRPRGTCGSRPLGAPRALRAVALGCRTVHTPRRAGVHTAPSACSPSGAGCRTTRPQRSAEATGDQPGVSTRGAIPMCGRRTVRPLAEPLSVASASAAHRSRVAAPWAPVQPRPVSLPMRQRPLPERRQSWLRTATVARRLHPPAGGRGVAHDARTARPVEAGAAASPGADARAGSYGDELEQRVRVVRLVPAPSSDARSLGAGGRWPRWAAAAARPSAQPRLRLCALQYACTPSRARPRNAGGNGRTFRAKTRRARRAGAAAPRPRSCACERRTATRRTCPVQRSRARARRTPTGR